MDAKIDEIVFLILGDEPLLFHTGKRGMFPAVSTAISRVLPADRLRWITFGHYESDECGAMNDFLAAAPHARAWQDCVPRDTQRHGRPGTASACGWRGD